MEVSRVGRGIVFHAKKNACKLAWEMYTIGQRTKVDKNPKRKVMEKRRVCQHTRTWKLIPGTSRLSQNLESLSTLW